MIYIFTYHKIRPASEADDGFYSVSATAFERQLEILKSAGFQELSVEALLANQTPPGKAFMLTFDDGTQDHFDCALPLLQKHHYQGVFFVPTAKLNKPGYLSNDHVRQLADAGQHIGVHSHDHLRLDDLPDDEVRRQIAVSQKILAGLTGKPPVAFAPPGGFMNKSVRRIALEEGVRIIRTMRWGYNEHVDLANLETIPINRHSNEKRFNRLLASRNSRFVYNAKETLKKLIPLRGYEALRNILFKLSKSN